MWYSLNCSQSLLLLSIGTQSFLPLVILMHGSQKHEVNHFHQADEKGKLKGKKREREKQLGRVLHYSWASLGSQELDVPKTSRQVVTISNIRVCHTYGTLIELSLTVSSKPGRWPPKWNWRMGFWKSMVISMLVSRTHLACLWGKGVGWTDSSKWKLEGLHIAPRVIDLSYSTWNPNKRQTGFERIK